MDRESVEHPRTRPALWPDGLLRRLCLAVGLVLTACASTPVLLTHPVSGAQFECPFPPSGMQRVLAPADAVKVMAAMADAERNHLGPVEYCVKIYEALGFARSSQDAAVKGLSISRAR